jgi:hypothetical protein
VFADFLDPAIGTNPSLRTPADAHKSGSTLRRAVVHPDMAFLRNVSGTAADNNGVKSACDRLFDVAARKGDYRYVYAEASSVRKPFSST